MSIPEEQEILLSQLVDGELPVDQANQVLADALDELAHVLGNAEAASKLNAMLQLRRALDSWRQQEPTRAIVVMPATCPTEHSSAKPSAPDQPSVDARKGAAGEGISHASKYLFGLATAAVLGGILVAGGFLLGGRFKIEPPAVPIAQQAMVIVTPEQRQEIARAFTLHESVAGPLSWYAADDSTIQVAPAGQGESLQQPIAVILRLTRDLSAPSGEAIGPKTYVIVCRNSDAVIELPQSTPAKTVHLRLLPTAINGEVSLQYAIAADGSDRGPDEAALAGRRHVGLAQTSLGQLAMNDCLVNVDASAWVIKN
jgi:hypothetical protein